MVSGAFLSPRAPGGQGRGAWAPGAVLPRGNKNGEGIGDQRRVHRGDRNDEGRREDGPNVGARVYPALQRAERRHERCRGLQLAVSPPQRLRGRLRQEDGHLGAFEGDGEIISMSAKSTRKESNVGLPRCYISCSNVRTPAAPDDPICERPKILLFNKMKSLPP